MLHGLILSFDERVLVGFESEETALKGAINNAARRQRVKNFERVRCFMVDSPPMSFHSSVCNCGLRLLLIP